MAEVKIGKNESLDSALRRFKRQCQRSTGGDRNEHYEKPSVRRKKKMARKREVVVIRLQRSARFGRTLFYLW